MLFNLLITRSTALAGIMGVAGTVVLATAGQSASTVLAGYTGGKIGAGIGSLFGPGGAVIGAGIGVGVTKVIIDVTLLFA